MRFMVQLLLAFFVGLALGYVLLSLCDIMGPLTRSPRATGDGDAALSGSSAVSAAWLLPGLLKRARSSRKCR
jgi:hypothetical protein